MHLPAIREFRIVNAPFALLSKLRERALTSRKSTRTRSGGQSPVRLQTAANREPPAAPVTVGCILPMKVARPGHWPSRSVLAVW